MAAITPGTMLSLLAHSFKPQQLSSRTRPAATCQFKHTNILSSHLSRSSFHSTALRNRPNLRHQKITPLSTYTCHQSTPSVSVFDRKLATVCQGQSRDLSGFSGFGSGKGGDSGKTSSLPPSFRTGSKWDMPARPSEPSATAPPSLLKRPIVPTPRAWDSLRGRQATEPVPVEDSQANIELNLKKLNAISNGTHRKTSLFVLVALAG